VLAYTDSPLLFQGDAMQFIMRPVERFAGPAPVLANSGPKGPPSAPPTIPPIIINPFNRQAPSPAIDPRPTPVRPPVIPPGRPGVRA
jgi:hypothetical protein